MRIVAITGLFWMANLAGSFYGRGFISFRFVIEVLIPIFIALTKVEFLLSPPYTSVALIHSLIRVTANGSRLYVPVPSAAQTSSSGASWLISLRILFCW
jgi:hypothetical protein